MKDFRNEFVCLSSDSEMEQNKYTIKFHVFFSQI